MSRSIDNPFKEMARDHIRIMDLPNASSQRMKDTSERFETYKDAPKVHQYKKNEVQCPMNGKNEYEHVVRQGLKEPIDWVESV